MEDRAAGPIAGKVSESTNVCKIGQLATYLHHKGFFDTLGWMLMYPIDHLQQEVVKLHRIPGLLGLSLSSQKRFLFLPALLEIYKPGENYESYGRQAEEKVKRKAVVPRWRCVNDCRAYDRSDETSEDSQFTISTRLIITYADVLPMMEKRENIKNSYPRGVTSEIIICESTIHHCQLIYFWRSPQTHSCTRGIQKA